MKAAESECMIDTNLIFPTPFAFQYNFCSPGEDLYLISLILLLATAPHGRRGLVVSDSGRTSHRAAYC